MAECDDTSEILNVKLHVLSKFNPLPWPSVGVVHPIMTTTEHPDSLQYDTYNFSLPINTVYKSKGLSDFIYTMFENNLPGLHLERPCCVCGKKTTTYRDFTSMKCIHTATSYFLPECESSECSNIVMCIQSQLRKQNKIRNNGTPLIYECVECGKMSKPGEPKYQVCGGCKLTNYCSRECQVKNWPVHKKLCKKE